MASILFKGCLVAGHKYFVRYIQHQKDKYCDGGGIDKDKLINLALNKYDKLCTKAKWSEKPQEEEKIMSLSANLEKRRTPT